MRTALLAGLALLAACAPPGAPDPATVLPVFPASAPTASGEWLYVAARTVPGAEHHMVFRTTTASFEEVTAFYREATAPGRGRPRAAPGVLAGGRAEAFVWDRGRDGRVWFVDVLRPHASAVTVIALGWAR